MIGVAQAAGIVAPLFLMMAAGWITSRCGYIKSSDANGMGAVVNRVLLPCLMFTNIYGKDFADGFDWPLVAFTVAAIAITFAACALLVPLFEKDDSRRAALVHALFRGNTTIYGIPIIEGLCGEQSVGSFSILLGLLVILYNTLGALTMQIFCPSGKKGPRGLLKALATNPLLIGGALGMACCLLKITVPPAALTVLQKFSAAASPLAFFVLGASFKLTEAREHMNYILTSSLVRLIIIPALWLALAAAAFKFSGFRLASLLAVFATPPAVVTFSIALGSGADSKLAGELVIFETAFSIFTLFIFITLLAGLV